MPQRPQHGLPLPKGPLSIAYRPAKGEYQVKAVSGWINNTGADSVAGAVELFRNRYKITKEMALPVEPVHFKASIPVLPNHGPGAQGDRS